MSRREEWAERIQQVRSDALLDGEEWNHVSEELWRLCATAYRDGVMDGLSTVPARYPQVTGAAVIVLYEAVIAWLRGEEQEQEEER